MSITVNCVIVGAQKSGTTALASFLSQHPDICVAPAKEVHLFDAPDFQDTRQYASDRYAAAFPNFAGQSVVLDATPIYMYFPWVLDRIQRYNPQMKVIAILRHPAERAISHYAMERARGTEPLPMWAAFMLEPYRLWRHRGDTSWTAPGRTKSYLDRGFYSRQLAHLLTRFPRDQVLVLRTEHLWRDHAGTLGRTYRFLGVEAPVALPQARAVRPDIERQRVSAQPSTPAVLATVLATFYRREIARLEALTGEDLDEWRGPPRALGESLG